MTAYHTEKDIKRNPRCNGIRRIHFRKDGTPEFGMTAGEGTKTCRIESALPVRKDKSSEKIIWKERYGK